MIDHATASAILARLGPALAAPTRRRVPLRADGAVAGWLDEARAERLAGFADVFAVNMGGAAFVSALGDERSRSEAMAGVVETLAREGALTQWRNEIYAAAPALGAPPWFRLERAAARYFGVHTWAAHGNGVVRGSPAVKMWFARRSDKKAIDPGKLDNLIGGGIAAEATVAQTLIKEAWEEAGIPVELATRALQAGVVEIWREQPDGLQSETIFVHDLWLPSDFVPVNQDGEAIEHRLVTMDEAARLIAVTEGPEEVTADASLVVVDFLLRHGFVDPASPEHSGLEALRDAHAAARLG